MPSQYAPPFSVIGTVLVGVLLVALGAGVARGPRVARALRAALARRDRDPAFLPRLYLRAIASGVVLTALAFAAVGFSPGIAWSAVGFGAPTDEGGWVAAFLVVFLVIAIALSRLRARRREPRVVPAAEASPALAMLPQTPAERRQAVAIALVAGIGEEIVFRGVLTAAGAGILGLPFLPALLLSLLLFAAGHLYQGPAALIGAGLIGVIFSGLYAISGSLLFPIVAHVAFDLIALLLPARVIVAPPGAERPVPPGPPAVPADLPVPPASPVPPTPGLIRRPEPSTEDL
jgi:membrane protease YdiL (CAAX protease family)